MSKTLKITPKTKGLKDTGYGYEYTGDLINDEGSIEIELGNKWLKVTGSIRAKFSIEAGEGIEARGGIEAGGGIEARWGIKAGEGIEAGWGILSGRCIKCSKTLSAGYRIFAGTTVYIKEVTKEGMLIQATKIEGEVAYGHVELIEEVKQESCNGKVVEIDGKKYKLTEV